MKKKFIIALSIIATLVAGTITGCAAYESSSHPEVISDTSISSENEPTSSEDSSSEYIIDSSEDESSETDSSEDESSEVEKVTAKTPKKVENISSENNNSSKETTTKKTETPKTTTTTKTTQAPVTQKPATTTKTTTKTPVTQPNGSHTHNWVKYREADGIKYYQCNICGELKEEGKKATITTPTPTSKPSHTHNWKPVYYTKYACYQATTDGNSFVSKTYYFRNENGDCASKQDLINYEKACIECEDYIGSPQNKTASTYAEIRKPFGPSNKVAFYYCVNGSNIEATFDPNDSEVFNFYNVNVLVDSVKKDGVWVKGTIFENM